MDPVLLSDIPGLDDFVRRATQREEDIRRRPFLPVANVIAGVPLLPLTLRHYTYLEAVQSPFLLHEFGELGDVLQFLWICSTEFVFPTPWVPLKEVKEARRLFFRRIHRRAGRCKLGNVCRKIRQMIDQALFECPKGRGRTGEVRPSIAHIAAFLIDEFREFGRPERLTDRGLPDYREPGIFDMPLARLFQYRRCVTAREHPGAALPNPMSDGAESAFIRKFAKRRSKRKGASA